MRIGTVTIIWFLNVIRGRRVFAFSSKCTSTLKPFHTTLNTEFYEIERKNAKEAPELREFIQSIIKKEKILFSIGTREFELRPLKDVTMTVNNPKRKSRLLGTFERVTVSRNNVLLLFSNGDISASGERYECIVRIVADPYDSYQYDIGSSPHRIILTIKLSDMMVSSEIKKISLISDKPTLGAKLLKFIKGNIIKGDVIKRNIIEGTTESSSLFSNTSIMFMPPDNRGIILHVNDRLGNGQRMGEAGLKRMAEQYAKQLEKDDQARNKPSNEPTKPDEGAHKKEPLKRLFQRGKYWKRRMRQREAFPIFPGFMKN